MNAIMKLDRRKFISAAMAAGGMLVIGVRESADAATGGTSPWSKENAPGASEFTPWLTINPDDSVIVRATAPDQGCGTITMPASYIMEELGTRWDKIRVEFASTNRDYMESGVYSKVGGVLGYFAGRSTGPDRMKTYLQVAASTRERLRTAAAQRWKVPVAEVEAKDSLLTHTPTGRTLRFGEVLAAAAAVRLEAEPAPKDRSQWTFLTKVDPPKIQLPQIVNGSAVYGIDVRLPNMVYAALRQSPVHGGKLKSYDFEAIRHMPGVHAVVAVEPRENTPTDLKPPFPFGLSTAQHAVAVIADHYWQARTALDALPVEWEDGPGAQWKTTEQMNEAALAAVRKPGEKIEKSVGDAAAAFKAGGRIVEAEYLTPYCEQSPMEPLNGTAMVTADRVDVWHPSQHTQMGFMVAADEAGVQPEKVHFHQTFIGGGFGRRVFSDDVRMVVAVARRFPGRPVHVIWSREEATRQGRYRALMGAKFRAVLGEDGMPTGFDACVSGGPGFMTNGFADTAMPAVVPHVEMTSQVVPFHILTGPYRGPGYNSNAFFFDTFLDECAVAAGIDPMEYRLKLYGKWADTGWVKCLREVRDQSGWSEKLPKGQGRGVAISNWGMGGKPDHGTTCAAVARVEVSKEGQLKILQIDVAFDSGRVINRDIVAAQLEGGTLFGLNMTLNEELTIKDGQIVEGNFDEYPMIRIGDTRFPIRIHFGGLTDHERYNEIGEPPVGPVGPAIGNAIFQATGKRLRTTPFRKHDLSWS
ncbi:MAG: molybdopterin-dependent oxidoreductase [Sphingobium sp.]